MSRKKPDAVSGVLVIDKHEGVTSHRIIQILRKLYDTPRVGHTGTLDPLATGVLPVLIGRAVKASEYVTAYDKRYIAEMKLGLTTDTEDITGTVLSRIDPEVCGLPSYDDVARAAERFIGEIEQIPPMYSAIKVDGRKLVDIAREGGEIKRSPRRVKVSDIAVEQISEDTYRLDVTCSKGTYIRTLCADIGAALGCGAVMSALKRVRTGCFTLEDAHTIEELEQLTFEERLALPRPAETLFADNRRVQLSDFYTKLFLCGAPLHMRKLGLHLVREGEDFETSSGEKLSPPAKPPIREGELLVMKQKDLFLGLGRAAVDADGIPVIKPEKLFYLPPAPDRESKT